LGQRHKKLSKSLDGEGFSDCCNQSSEWLMLLDKIQQALLTKLNFTLTTRGDGTKAKTASELDDEYKLICQ